MEVGNFYKGHVEVGNSFEGHMKVGDYVEELEEIIRRGGPEISECGQLENACNNLMKMELTVEEQLQLHETLKPILSKDNLIGFSYLKPYGYSGDFDIIDKMYQKWTSPTTSKFHKWDNFFHNLHSVRAVRNRKDYFVNELCKVSKKVDEPKVLNLASGPCTDLNQFFKIHPRNKAKIDCLDMDKTAIEYGSVMCDGFIDSVNFINRNAFRYKTEKKYDLIWSAGLFDYFNDKLFMSLIKRMYGMLSENGTLVVGNFSDINPSRGAMEVLGQWYMHHRSERNLIDLAMKVGISRDKISVNCEATKVNLFIHIEK